MILLNISVYDPIPVFSMHIILLALNVLYLFMNMLQFLC